MAHPDSLSPHIEITLREGAATIRQHRPAVLSQLVGMDIDTALELVPRLLPICGAAQSIAAARAVEAARGKVADADQEQRREQELTTEQALSAGWRLAVDWPDLLGENRQMAWLKQLRSSADRAEIAGQLQAALPRLDALHTPGDLREWAGGRHCTAARLLDDALAGDCDSDCNIRSGRELEQTARAVLGQPGYDSNAPSAEPLEVGPLAMARDSLVRQLAVQQVYRAPARRIAAQVLDCRHIAAALCCDPSLHANAWNESGGSGCGRAITARGPVFHRVTLDDSDRVAGWRTVAPTDWHFAAHGPLWAALQGTRSTSQARLLVAGFDPCVPCHIKGGED